MRTLIIGEAPSKNAPDNSPIEGRIGRRLAEFCGLSYEDFLVAFERTNLLEVRQDTKEKGFVFDRKAAAFEAGRIYESLAPDRTIVLLGKRVRDAFGIVKDYFEPHRHPNGSTFYVVSHPSGVNRWWNDPENKEAMRTFLRGGRFF